MRNLVRLLILVLVFQPMSSSAWTALLENGDTTLAKLSTHHSNQSAPESHATKIGTSQEVNCCSSGNHHDMEDCLATCLIYCGAACAAPAIVPADIGLHHVNLGDQYWPISPALHPSRSEPPEIHPPHLYHI